ncbi:MAG: hypothetical protein IPK22_22585 [Verrucomicrobiaceae bacterium]|nr:hypothetical protein [Verrucomicrobiaceae bacterium]
MNTNANPTAIVSRVLIALGATALLSSCSMPPRQAWNMIQRDGLFNYWAYSSGHQPSFNRPSPPLQQASSQSLAYRPSYTPYGQPRVSYTPPTRSSSAPVANRYYAPSTSPAPAPQIAQPSYRPKTSSSPRRSTKPRIVKVDDEPVYKPSVVDAAPKKSPSPSPSKPSSSPAPKKELPYGNAVAGRPNMVNSPYASKTQLVDVAGMGPGQTVKCPYSGKLFRVPPTQQAANKVESKLDAPALSSPSKSDDKPKSPSKPEDKPKSEPKTSEAPKSEPKAESKAEEKKP